MGHKGSVESYEKHLLEEGLIEAEKIEQIRSKWKQEIQAALDAADAEDRPVFDLENERADLFADPETIPQPPEGSKREMRLLDAISEALDQSMEAHPELVLMGQDIGAYGGVFKATEGLQERYGPERVRNTPLCESAIIGAGLGLSMKGMKAMVEMQFADFVSEGMTQICNNLAKIHYRWGNRPTWSSACPLEQVWQQVRSTARATRPGSRIHRA